MRDCEQNVFFVRAARACVDKLEREIGDQQALLSAALALSSAAAASSQSARIENSAADLQQMKATLSALEAEARAARTDLAAYSQSFLYGGPVSPELARKLKIEHVLQHAACFENNLSLLGLEMKYLDQDIADLEKGAKAAEQLASVNKTNLKKMDASSNNAVAHGRAPASASEKKVPAGTSSNGYSSITGTEKASADESRSLDLINKKP